jgi:hypothetical protein
MLCLNWKWVAFVIYIEPCQSAHLCSLTSLLLINSMNKIWLIETILKSYLDCCVYFSYTWLYILCVFSGQEGAPGWSWPSTGIKRQWIPWCRKNVSFLFLYFVILSLLVVTEFTYATSADQDQLEHKCRLIMVCTVCYSARKYFWKFSRLKDKWFYMSREKNGWVHLKKIQG